MSRTAVAPEHNADFDTKGTDEWLDGLAGRGGNTAPAQEAAALRQALKLSDAKAAATRRPGWARIVAAAARTAEPAGAAVVRNAANAPAWKRLAAGGLAVAALAVGVGYWSIVSRDADTGGGMRGAPTAGGAVWKTEDPAGAARDLAARLESLGARVTMTRNGDTTHLQIQCGAGGAERLNQELAALEVGLDSNCAVLLRVAPLH